MPTTAAVSESSQLCPTSVSSRGDSRIEPATSDEVSEESLRDLRRRLLLRLRRIVGGIDELPLERTFAVNLDHSFAF